MSAGQVVLITGTSSGFGRLTAETLARRGHTVYASMRAVGGKNAAVAQELADFTAQEKVDLRVIELDVNDDASVAQAVETILAASGRLDAVVNNVGLAAMGPLEAFTEDQVAQVFGTNVYSVLRVNRAVLPSMRAQGSGLLLQVGSIVGRLALPYISLYGATKFALEGLTEAYRQELAGTGVDAAIVEPGFFPTKLGSNAVVASDQSRFPSYVSALTTFRAAVTQANTQGNDGLPPDPQQVADAIAEPIALPNGQRPLRTVVAVDGQREGSLLVNETTERASRAMISALGLTPNAALS